LSKVGFRSRAFGHPIGVGLEIFSTSETSRNHLQPILSMFSRFGIALTGTNHRVGPPQSSATSLLVGELLLDPLGLASFLVDLV